MYCKILHTAYILVCIHLIYTYTDVHSTYILYAPYTHTLTYNPAKVLPLRLPMCPYTIYMVEAHTEKLVESGGVLEDIPVIASGRQVSSLHTGRRGVYEG